MTSARVTTPPVSESEALSHVRALLASGASALEPLLAMRIDPNWTVRREVVAGLGSLGADALPRLCESLIQERDNETRIAATVDALVASNGDAELALAPLALLSDPAILADVAQVLGRRRNRASIDTLALLVDNVDDNVAVAAIEALGRVGGRRVVDVLVKAVESRRFFRSFAAIDVLGRSGDPRALAPLISLLDNAQCGFEATRALGRTGDRAAVQALCRLLVATSDGVVRAAALALLDLRQKYSERFGTSLPIEEALRRATSGAAARRLMNCMNGADTAEQIAILVVLGCLREEAAMPTLLQALDASPSVAAVAADVLKQFSTNSEAQAIEALKGGTSLRREALLPIISSRDGIDAVSDCLRDDSAVVRRMACEALARVGNPGVTPALFRSLHDTSPAVVQAAIAAIATLGSGDTTILAMATMASGEPAARRAALRILSYTGRAEALPAFEAGVRDSDARVREAAIHGLALIESPRALELLLALADDSTPTTRASAVRALGATTAEPVVNQALINSLDDLDPWVRYYACQALGKLGVSSAVKAVAARLEDVAGQVRVSAIEALSHLGGEEAFAALCQAAEGTDLDQRRAALIGLGLSRKPEAVATLLSQVSANDVATRLIAVAALANFPDSETHQAFEQAVHDADDSVRAAAIGFLGKRGSTEATLLLVSLLKDPANAERAQIALSEPQAERVAGLSAALHGADDEHAMQLTHILARLHGPEATAALFEALTVSNIAARKAAATTLAAIGSPEALSTLRRLTTEDADAEVRRVCLLLLEH